VETDACFVRLLQYCPTPCLTVEKEDGNKANGGIDMLQNNVTKAFFLSRVNDIKRHLS
jgi:hypothetical protein